jgi:hypothetical protein
MAILKFKQFESIQYNFDFPSFKDIEEYFYDFTDEIDSKIYGYQSGYKIYLKPFPNSTPYKDIISNKFNFIDITNTDIPNRNLSISSNYCILDNLNFPEPFSRFDNKVALNSIKSGAKAYKHLMIQFEHPLFSKSKLNILIECLKMIYDSEGFRPYGDLWTEDWIKPGYSTTEERIGFTGLLVNCSDEEYIKMAKLIEQRPMNKKLIQHFL